MVETTRKSFEILQELSDRDGASLDTLHGSNNFARSTIHDHLETLRDLGVVRKSGSTYHISIGILEHGGQARSQYDSYLVGRDEIDDLATKFETLVQIAFMEEDICVYLYQAGQRYLDVPKPRLGTKVGFHSSAAGKAIAASLPADRQKELIEDRELQRYTKNTTTDREKLYTEFEEIRSAELAFDFEEQFEDIWCVSTPTTFRKGHIGAVSISLPADQVDRSFLKNDIADEVHKCGRLIETDRQYEDWIGQTGERT